MPKTKDKDNIESSKGEVTCHVQGILNREQTSYYNQNRSKGSRVIFLKYRKGKKRPIRNFISGKTIL